MSGAEIFLDEQDGIPVIRVRGYLDLNAGRALLERADPFLIPEKVRIILDLAGAKVIPSPGVSAILDLVVKVVQDRHGKLVLTGLDPLKRRVFQVVGILPLAEVAPTVEAALARVKDSGS